MLNLRLLTPLILSVRETGTWKNLTKSIHSTGLTPVAGPVILDDIIKKYGLGLRCDELMKSVSLYQESMVELLKFGLKQTDLRKIQRAKFEVLSETWKKIPVFQDFGDRERECFFSLEFVDFANAQEEKPLPSLSNWNGPYKPLGLDNREAAVYETVVKFGRKICKDHPNVFRDLYRSRSMKLPAAFLSFEEFACRLMGVKNISDDQIRKARLCEAEKKFGTEFRLKWVKQIMESIKKPETLRMVSLPPDYQTAWNSGVKREPRSLMAQLAAAPAEDWYMYQNGHRSRFPWTMFWYLRTLPTSPFDPSNNTDYINPEISEIVYEQAGLAAASAPGTRLSISWTPEFEDIDTWDDWE